MKIHKKRFPFARFIRALIFFAVVVFNDFGIFSTAQITNLWVEKLAIPTDVEPFEEFSINIVVHGYSIQTSQAVPFDAILLIDRSPSMEDELSSAKEAAKLFVTRAEQASQTSTQANIKIGLVTFDEKSHLRTNLEDDYNDLRSLIDDIHVAEDTFTNMAGGMETANELLEYSTRNNKIVILLTDGYPNYQGYDYQVENILLTQIPNAILKGIRYFTVGVSGADTDLLKTIAELTSGEASAITTSQLESQFSHIFDSIAFIIEANRVVLNEFVDMDKIEIVPDSCQISEGCQVVGGESGFIVFENTGNITIEMGTIPSNRNRTFSFRARIKGSVDPEFPEEYIEVRPNKPEAIVSYYFGELPGSAQVPDTIIKLWKTGFALNKWYDASNDDVVITIRNLYRHKQDKDNSIRSITIEEMPSLMFHYKIDSVRPEARIFPEGDSDRLIWYFETLKPQENIEMRFKVDLAAYTPRDTLPLYINTKSKDYVFCRAKFKLPGSDQITSKYSKQAYYPSTPILENIPEGRPDLYIEPAYSYSDFLDGVLDMLTVRNEIYIRQRAGNLPSGWPWSENVFLGVESPDIWIDSEINEFVSQWEPVSADITDHLANVVSPEQISGQGDLWSRSYKNRLCIRIHNFGSGSSKFLPEGILVYLKNQLNGAWDLKYKRDLDPIAGHLPGQKESSLITYIETGSIKPQHLKQILKLDLQGYWWNAWIGELKIQIKSTDKEKHVLNNTTTETFMIVQ